MQGDGGREPIGPKRDKRFANPLWDTHPYFNYVKQQYALNAKPMQDAVHEADDLDPVEKRRLAYFRARSST